MCNADEKISLFRAVFYDSIKITWIITWYFSICSAWLSHTYTWVFLQIARSDNSCFLFLVKIKMKNYETHKEKNGASYLLLLQKLLIFNWILFKIIRKAKNTVSSSLKSRYSSVLGVKILIALSHNFCFLRKLSLLFSVPFKNKWDILNVDKRIQHQIDGIHLYLDYVIGYFCFVQNQINVLS